MNILLNPEYIDLKKEVMEYLKALKFRDYNCACHQYCKDRYAELLDLAHEFKIPTSDIPYMEDLWQHIAEYENEQIILKLKSKFLRVQ